MPHLIDTNIAIYLRDGQPDIVRRLADAGNALAISLVTLVELEGGIEAQPALAPLRRARVNAMLSEMRVVALDRGIVAAYGDIVRAMGYSRVQLIDRLIAATAISHDLTLITINGDDFRKIPGLSLEVWPDPAVQ